MDLVMDNAVSPQIGPEDSLSVVLSKTTAARRWVAERPVAEDAVAKLPSTIYKLRVSAHIPAGSPAVVDVFQPAFARLQAVSGGRLQVAEYWDGSLHSERDGVAALKSGLTDLCPVYSAWDPQAFPAAQALSLPFLFSSAEVATRVSERLYDQYFRRDVERQGILMGRMVSTSEYNLFTRAPIASLADLKLQKIACSDGVEQAAFKALGALPVPCSTPQACRLFAAGEVAGVSVSDSAAHTTGLYKHARFRTSMGMLRVSLEYCLSASFYESLPTALKVVLNDWLRGLAQAGAQLFYGLAGARAREEFRHAGIQTILLEGAEKQAWDEAVASVVTDVVASIDRSGYDGRKLLAALRAGSEACAEWSADDLMIEAENRPGRDMLPGLPQEYGEIAV